MRISLKVGTVYYPLAGEAGVSERAHTSAADFQLSAEAGKQIIQRVRGAYVQVVDRGNLMHSVRFTTARQFATPAAAFLAVLDHDAAMPRAGVLVLDAEAPDGGIYRRLMASAVVTPPARRVIGATAFYDYSVDGGAITDGGYTAPTAVAATGTLTVETAISSYEFEIGIYGSAQYFASEAPSAAAARIAAQINADTFLLVTAAAVGAVVTLTAKAAGTAGNAITLVASSSGLTASGATLTGGLA
jgi:hypothetical protein